MGYAKEKIFGHMKVQKKIGTHEGPKVSRKK
jgi:hypothetical protein